MIFSKNFQKIFLSIILSLSFWQKVNAELIKPQKYGTEKRFKTWTYHPNGVYYLEAHYMHPSYVEFGEKEVINTIYSPKPEAWLFVPVKNRLFIKAIKDDADTTLTVMTNERTYFFELHAKYAKGPFDPDVTFFIKFRYPYQAKEIGQGASDSESIIQFITDKIPDLSKPEMFNFNYTVSGDYSITPLKIFDDGNFTYMEFRQQNGIIPAVFLVDSNGFENMVNFRMVGHYLAIESIASVFTLRYGADTVCVFNEALRGITRNLVNDNLQKVKK
jgi:type IV secretion system protein VirB9